MDAEMVAAALEVAHEQVIKKLPSYYAQMPIGWRFKDKFIQLPIIIPPSPQENVKAYANTLLVEYPAKDIKNSKEIKADEKVAFKSDTDAQSETGPNVPTPTGQNSAQNKLVLKPEQMKHIHVMRENIEDISDTDEEFLKQVSQALADFSFNPREIKRFINALRFQRFLMTSREKPKSDLSFDQVRRWTILSLKWPQVERWLYWGISTFGNNSKDK
jgi:hypothetical protein